MSVDMTAVFRTYPYLVFSLGMLLIFMTLFLINPGQRRFMLLSGVLSVPFAFTSVLFVPEYWNPVRVANFLTGPEDIIFSFANGGIVWLMAVWPIRKRIILKIQTGGLIMRYVAWSSSGVAFSLILQSYGIGVMTATIVTIAAFGLLLICIRGTLWPIPVAGAIGFTTFYTIFFGTTLTINPDFIMQWNIENLWGMSLLGIPIEELAWAIAFGSCWPLFIAYLFEARLGRSGLKAKIINESKDSDISIETI